MHILKLLLTYLKEVYALCGWPILIIPAIILILACVFGCCVHLYRKCDETAKNRRFIQLILATVLIIWSICWGLYMIAISCNANAQTGVLEKIFRSATAAIGMFAFNIDSNIFDNINQYAAIKGALSLMSFLAGGCTLLLLVQIIFMRFRASTALGVVSMFHKILKKHNLFVFYGNNHQTQLLAESIRDHYKNINSNDYRIIIVEPPLSEDDKEQYDIPKNLIRLFTHRPSSLAEARKKNTFLAVASVDIAEIPTSDNECDIFEIANLHSVKKLLNASNTTIRMFFLSDNEEHNIACVNNISKDTTVNNLNQIPVIYCRARRNDIYRAIEDLAIRHNLDVRITDPSNLSIELLKRDVENHPITLMDIDTENNYTTVKSAFNAMIIGFDATGRDAFRFMYEFGAFVDSSSTTKNVRRSPFHCTIVDNKAGMRATAVKTWMPAVAEARNHDGTPLVEFHECDYNSDIFYSDMLTAEADKLNMIFITVGNDEDGLALAVRILKHLWRLRTNMDKLRIFLRCSSSQREALTRLTAKHYNEGLTHRVIIPFGYEKDIYTYDIIVDEYFREQGRQYQENYARLKGDFELWDLRRELLTGTKKYRKDKVGNKIKDENGKPIIDDVPVYLRKISLTDLKSLRRKEYQDMANAIHAKTKLHLLKQVMPMYFDWGDFIHRYFDCNGKPKSSGFGSNIKYEELNEHENKIIRSLAMLEHLRWNASHELLGYVRAADGRHECDERTMEHNCLRDWQELDEESVKTAAQNGWDADYISFDFAVVNTTISMNKESLINDETIYSKAD